MQTPANKLRYTIDAIDKRKRLCLYYYNNMPTHTQYATNKYLYNVESTQIYIVICHTHNINEYVKNIVKYIILSYRDTVPISDGVIRNLFWWKGGVSVIFIITTLLAISHRKYYAKFTKIIIFFFSSEHEVC